MPRKCSLFGHLIANGILGRRNGTLLHFIDVFMHLPRVRLALASVVS